MNAEARKAWGSTWFCDDIRTEIDGKVTLVGIYYGKTMAVNGNFPATIPKLGIVVNYAEIPDAFVGNAQIEVYFPGDREPIIKSELAMGGPRALAKTVIIPEDTDLERIANASFSFLVAPALLKEPGYIRVRIRTDNALIKVGACQVIQGPILPVGANPEPSGSGRSTTE